MYFFVGSEIKRESRGRCDTRLYLDQTTIQKHMISQIEDLEPQKLMVNISDLKAAVKDEEVKCRLIQMHPLVPSTLEAEFNFLRMIGGATFGLGRSLLFPNFFDPKLTQLQHASIFKAL